MPITTKHQYPKLILVCKKKNSDSKKKKKGIQQKYISEALQLQSKLAGTSFDSDQAIGAQRVNNQ